MSSATVVETPRHSAPPPPAPAQDHSSRNVWLQVALLGALALVARLINIDHTPYIDEMNHALAARLLLTEGTLDLGGGTPYTRSWLFTYLVAGSIALFGDNLVAARVPAVIAGVGLVLAVFLWVRRVAGGLAAWIAALLTCFAPISLYLSQQSRFYTLQTLLVFVGAVSVYSAAGPDRTPLRRGLLAVGALACFAVAFHLQPITAVAVATIGLWLALDRGPSLLRWMRGSPGRAAAVAAAVLLAVVAVALSGVINTMLGNMRYADLWAEGNRENARYYHDLFLGRYPTLWTLYPVAALLALSRYTRATLFCVVLFASGFVFHSISAWKHERYLFYVMPFLFATWGMATAVVLPWLRERFDAALAAIAGGRPGSAVARAAWIAGLAFAVLFAAAGNNAFTYTYRMLTLSDEEWTLGPAYRGEANWAAVLPVLEREAAQADVVLTSAMLKAMYYMRRAPMGLSATEVLHGSPEEFSLAPKEGVPVISRVESLEQVHRCVPRGLVIADRRSYRRDWGVTTPVADYLESGTEQLPLDPKWGVIAFRWNQPAPGGEAGCAAILSLLPAHTE